MSRLSYISNDTSRGINNIEKVRLIALEYVLQRGGVFCVFVYDIILTGFMPRKTRFVSGVKRHVSEKNN